MFALNTFNNIAFEFELLAPWITIVGVIIAVAGTILMMPEIF